MRIERPHERTETSKTVSFLFLNDGQYTHFSVYDCDGKRDVWGIDVDVDVRGERRCDGTLMRNESGRRRRR